MKESISRQLICHAGQIAHVDVFTRDGEGGNPCPVVLDATSLSDADMLAVARHYEHESAFILPATQEGADIALRFFVPTHEMTMCGHATLGALWSLRHFHLVGNGHWRIQTCSGVFSTIITDDAVCLSQSSGTITPLSHEDAKGVLDVLGIGPDDLTTPVMFNASTSRTKTLLQLNNVDRLHQLRPRFEDMPSLCDQLRSTGLYPFVKVPSPTLPYGVAWETRQFPCASGYPEDAATGIAATALCAALPHFGHPLVVDRTTTIYQGHAMGRPSCLHVTPSADGSLWLSGAVSLRHIAPWRPHA